jgi:hypothetical protein
MKSGSHVVGRSVYLLTFFLKVKTVIIPKKIFNNFHNFCALNLKINFTNNTKALGKNVVLL